VQDRVPQLGTHIQTQLRNAPALQGPMVSVQGWKLPNIHEKVKWLRCQLGPLGPQGSRPSLLRWIPTNLGRCSSQSSICLQLWYPHSLAVSPHPSPHAELGLRGVYPTQESALLLTTVNFINKIKLLRRARHWVRWKLLSSFLLGLNNDKVRKPQSSK
jgi:hypothetical protein